MSSRRAQRRERSGAHPSRRSPGAGAARRARSRDAGDRRQSALVGGGSRGVEPSPTRSVGGRNARKSEHVYAQLITVVEVTSASGGSLRRSNHHEEPRDRLVPASSPRLRDRVTIDRVSCSLSTTESRSRVVIELMIFSEPPGEIGGGVGRVNRHR